jgi:putative endopeptidase
MKTRKYIKQDVAPHTKLKNNHKISDDFYDYVNGIWRKQHAHILPTQTTAGIVSDIQNKINARIINHANRLISGQHLTRTNHFLSKSQIQHIKEIFTATHASLSSSNQYNMLAFQKFIGPVLVAKTKEDIVRCIGRLSAYQIPTLLSIGTSQDDYDRNYQVIKIFGSDFTLGDRQYYWNHKLGTQHFFDKYATYLKWLEKFWDIHGLDAVIGVEKRAYPWYKGAMGQESTKRIWQFSELIRSFPSLKYFFEGLTEEMPELSWKSYEYAVDKTASIHFLNKCLAEVSIEHLRSWLIVFIINNYGLYITPAIADKWHEIFQDCMLGIPKRLHEDYLWLELMKTKAPIILNEFVRDFCLDPKRRAEVAKFFKKIQEATIDLLVKTEWLDPPTREKAIHKVKNLKIDISYPMGSYKFPLAKAAANLTSDCLFHNALNLDKEDFKYNILSVVALNHTPWDNPIFVVNAHYWDYENRIFFPGGILEPPNFLMQGARGTRKNNSGRKCELGWNYGNLGATLGHEITHAFDVEGMKVTAEGIKHEWATSDDKRQYAEKVADLEAVFQKIRQDGLKLDTPYIISEAIADLGGLSIALNALKKDMEGLGWSVARKQEEIRRFFISFAYSWQQKMRPESRIRRVYIDEHPPAWTRVNYIVNHFSDWYEAFGINDGKLYIAPEERVQFFSG